MKVLFTKDYGKEKFDKIRELGYEIMYYNENIVTNNEDVDSADILVTYNPFRTLDINKMENLKYIQTTSIGIDQIPVDKILNRDIVIANNKGGYSIPIGEWIVMSILEIYKNTKFFIKNQDNKVWEKKRDLLELTDKTVTIVGCGNVGSEVAKRLKSFGCKINGVARRQVQYDYIDKVYSMEELNETLKISDIVVLTIALNKETKHLFDKERFNVMKDEAVLVNVARGAIVNEEDLIEVLNSGKFMGVALDVMENEPLCVSSEL